MSGKVLRRVVMTFARNDMASFSGTTSFASDAARAALALLMERRSSPASITSPKTWSSSHGISFSPSMHSRDNGWHPTRGIIFGESAPATPSPPPRYARAYSTNAIEHELALHSAAEDSYVLAGSIHPTSDLSSPVTSIIDHDWAPSVSSDAASATDSAVEEENTESRDLNKEGHVPLSFKIPEAEFERAKKAEADTPESFWSHRLYEGPQKKRVTVHYCTKKHTTERVIKTYFQDKPVLGFDIEWQPNANARSGIKKNVALVQLASEDRIGLFHIALFAKDSIDDLVAPSLKTIMEDPEVSKVGVAIRGDCTRMRTHLGMECRGIFELSHLYKLVKYSQAGTTSLINKRLVSLASQVHEHLGLPLYKGDDVRGSDWTQELDLKQIQYAAADSYAGFMLYDIMESKRKGLNPAPPRPYHVERDIPIRLASGVEIPTLDEPPLEDAAPKSLTPVVKKKRISGTASKGNVNKADNDSRPATIVSAEAWARMYRSDHPLTVYTKETTRCPAPFPTLRAYYLWQNENFDLEEIASLLAIKETTVISYVSVAIGQEKLPFDPERYEDLLSKARDSERKSWRVKTVVQMMRDGKIGGLAWQEPEEEAEARPTV